MNEPTYKRVCRVIGELAGIDPETISPGQSLGQTHSPNHYWQSLVINAEPPRPIGFDSLDLVQLAMELEEEFSIQISDDEVDDRRLDHVGGLVAFVQGKLDAKPKTYGDIAYALAAYYLRGPHISDAAEPEIVETFDDSTGLLSQSFDGRLLGSPLPVESISRAEAIERYGRPGAEL